MKKKIDQDKLVWKSEYSIGHFRTDNEHMKLFNIAKKALNAKKKNGEDVKELRAIVHSLYEYIGSHFRSEEAYMREIVYPDYEKHKAIHKELLDTLHQFVQTLNELSIDQIEIQLYEFIENYFISHIVDEDKRIEYWNKSLSRLRKSTKWLKAYETGNEMFDNEHKELFDILNKAFEDVEDEKREQKIKDVLTILYDFMKKHFKEEEDYMKEIKYPQMKDHVRLHHEIIEGCNELVLQVNDMEDSLFEKELAKIIDEYITAHMLNEDKKIIEWENLQKEEEEKKELEEV